MLFFIQMHSYQQKIKLTRKRLRLADITPTESRKKKDTSSEDIKICISLQRNQRILQ